MTNNQNKDKPEVLVVSPQTEREPQFISARFAVTPAVLHALSEAEIGEALSRHFSGDWGEVCEADAQENELSLREGYRILSAYTSKAGEKFWVITEADRSVTTVLFPREY